MLNDTFYVSPESMLNSSKTAVSKKDDINIMDILWNYLMSKIDFGKNLKAIRKAKGVSQRELSRRIGLSQRMIAYYEGPGDFPDAEYVIKIAKALSVSIDDLFGYDINKDPIAKQNVSLWKKLKTAEQLPKKDQKILVDTLEVLIAKQKLKQSA